MLLAALAFFSGASSGGGYMGGEEMGITGGAPPGALSSAFG